MTTNDDKNFKKGMIEALNYLHKEIEKDGWDQPARLFELESVQLDPDDADKGYLVGCAEVIEGGITSHPPVLLDKMAKYALEAIGTEDAIAPRPHVMGFLLSTEGYGVVGEADQTIEEIYAQSPTGKLADHPDRVEVRTLAVVDITGNWCMGNWYRDEEKLIAEGKKLPFMAGEGFDEEQRFNSIWDGMDIKDKGAVLNALWNFTSAFHLANTFATIQAKGNNAG